MKLVWSPESASKAYIDTVESSKAFGESGVAELISAMAGGWNAKLIVQAWSRGGTVATSLALSIAARHTGGRHVCLVPDERSRLEYTSSILGAGGTPPPEVVVGGAEAAMAELVGVDFLVVDGRRRDFAGVLRFAKLNTRGAVLVCKNACQVAGFNWGNALGSTRRVKRSVVMPVGQGLDIAYVAAVDSVKRHSRWIRRVDEKSGEEHMFRG